MKKVFSILFACVLVFSFVAFGLPAFADPGSIPYPEDPDPGEPWEGYTGDPYTRDPTELMTKEYFGNEWVNTIPDDPSVTSPWEHHGYIAGSPAQLTPFTGPEGTYDYFATLASESPRVKMWDIGKTTMGLKGLLEDELYEYEEYIVAVSSADTIARLDQYQENLQKLADPRKLGYPEDVAAADAAVEKLIKDASELKPIFWFCVAPSSETGGKECSMELAYRLAVDKRPLFKEIRDNVIVFFTDTNPDGTEIVADWVNYYMQDPEWKDREPGPPYYNWYTQHDNNRDTITNSEPERLNLVKAYNEWPAQFALEPHEVGFLLYTFSGMEPTTPATDPITQTEWQWFAARELNQAEQFGMPGVWCYRYVNMYYPFYQIQQIHFKGGTGKFYEVQSRGFYPTTYTRSVSSRNRAWYWYSPMPYKYSEIVWSRRNNINYQQTAALTSIRELAQNREYLLWNYWTKQKNAISKAGTTDIGCSGEFTYAYAYVIPAEQKDMPDTIRMINNLLGNGVEIHTADDDFEAGENEYPAGSFIINMVQPYSRLIHVLFNIEYWPEGMPAPYDATAWQYDLMRDVVVDRIDEPDIYDVPMTPVTAEELAYPYTVSDEIAEGYYVVEHNSINNIITLVFGLGEYEVYAAEEADDGIDVGDVIIPANQEEEGVYEAVVGLVEELGLTMHSVEAAVEVETHPLDVPKVGLYHAWRSIQDGGWSRLTFERFLEEGVDYDVIQHTDVVDFDEDGNPIPKEDYSLKDYYDVIFLPDCRGRNLERGNSPGSVPEEVGYGGVQTEHRTGGLGDAGIAEFKQFVDDGGLLICNNAATDFPIDNDFIEDVTRIKDWNAPGPIVRILPVLGIPITYGADEEECIYQNQSPAFDVNDHPDWVVAYYPDEDEIFLSGFLEGAEEMEGLAVIVDAPAKDGDGHVVLFGCDITYRWQAHGAYFYLWNAIMNWNDLP